MSYFTVNSRGAKTWRNNEGRLHRLDGPAYEAPDGYKSYIKNGAYHRLDGPAIEYPDGTKIWYHEGYCVFLCASQEEFERWLRLKAFL